MCRYPKTCNTDHNTPKKKFKKWMKGSCHLKPSDYFLMYQ